MFKSNKTVQRLTKDPDRLAALCGFWRDAEREVWLTMLSDSMSPTIPTDSRMKIRFSRKPPQLGDIIAYQFGGSLIVHRIVTLEEDLCSGARRLICLGDANRDPDPPIAVEAALGRVVEIRTPSGLRRLRRSVSLALRKYDPLVRTVRTLRRRPSS